MKKIKAVALTILCLGVLAVLATWFGNYQASFRANTLQDAAEVVLAKYGSPKQSLSKFVVEGDEKTWLFRDFSVAVGGADGRPAFRIKLRRVTGSLWAERGYERL